MLVKATTNFSGTVTVTVGDTRELDGAVLNDLLRCGYVVPAEKPKPKAKEKADEAK